MEILVKISNNSRESEISRITKYLRTLKFVKKFDIFSDDFRTIKNISDKETVGAIHKTSSKSLAAFLKNETEPIF